MRASLALCGRGRALSLRLVECSEWRIEEDVSVFAALDYSVERSVAGADDCHRTRDKALAVPVAEVISLAKRFELSLYLREEVVAVCFEVYKEDERLFGIELEDAAGFDVVIFLAEVSTDRD